MWTGMFIPDPGSRGQNITGSRIRNTGGKTFPSGQVFKHVRSYPVQHHYISEKYFVQILLKI